MSGCCCATGTAKSLNQGVCTESQVVRSSGGDWGRLVWACVAAAQGMILSLGLNVSDVTGITRWVLHGVMVVVALAVGLLAGRELWSASWKALAQRRVVTEQFFVLGIFAAFVISLQSTLRGHGPIYYEVVAVLVAIHALGTLLGGRRRKEFERFRNAIRDEYSTCLLRDAAGGWRRVSVHEVNVGDEVLVPKGEAASIDGKIVGKAALVEESALTGEPFPVVRRAGDVVLAGTVARDGDVVLKVTAKAGTRALDEVLGTIESAGRLRGNLQLTADRLSALLMPTVLTAASGALAFWWWHTDFDTGLMRALAVIVVACPCAMGLATPLGVWGALVAFARRGLLAHSGDVVERLARVDEVSFDKTGTLSEARPTLVDWVADADAKHLPLRAMVSTVEQRHEHPMSQALRFGEELPQGWNLVTSSIIPGVGVEGRFLSVSGAEFTLRVGTEEIFTDKEKNNVTFQMQRLRAESFNSAQWSHEIWVSVNGKAVALALLREMARPDAREAIDHLQSLGLKVNVLTGDREEALAQLGLKLDCESRLSASEKGERVGSRQKSGSKILYVGDGLNDAVAMSLADVSVALGSGNRVALKGASAVLQGGGLKALAECIALSRRVVRDVEGNMVLAVAYNTVGIILAVTGLINPIVAAFLMLISSATVSWRALRSARHLDMKPPKDLNSHRDSSVTFLTEDKVIVPRTVAALLALAVWVQPPLLSWLAGYTIPVINTMIFLGALLSLSVWRVLTRGPLDRSLAWIAVMLASGNLGMLIGWCGEWGFQPLVREGNCLCGCPMSIYGQGVGFGFSWMHVGMILGCAPIFLLRGLHRLDSSKLLLLGRCSFCFVGMWLGMGSGALLVGPLQFSSQHVQFFANFGTMVFGMLLGMVLLEKLPRGVLSLLFDRYLPARPA